MFQNVFAAFGRFPRTRGDRPYYTIAYTPPGQVPPHARG